MSDLPWLKMVFDVAPDADARKALCKSKGYKDARKQWDGGASERVVAMLLERAAAEIK
jgi:hypothetical protein